MASNFRVGIAVVTGLLVLVVGCVMGWYGFPAILSAVIQKQLVLTPSSTSFAPWQDPSSQVDIYMQFIVFNVTNGDEVIAGEKPNVTEVGPFSYKETRERIDLVWSDDGTELTYNETIMYVFDEATSGEGVTEDTLITTINAPMVVVAAMGDARSALEKLVLHNIINSQEDGASIVQYKAGELIMSGADDPLLNYIVSNPLTKDLVPPTFADGKFRLYAYNNTIDGPYRIKTGKNDIDHFTYVQSYKHNTTLTYWNTPYCNMINGTDGITYPPNTGDTDRIYIFNKDLCRSIYLDYQKDVEYFGIAGRRFSPIKAVLDDPDANPDNKCFCVPENSCYKAGVMTLSPCQYDAPIVASTPHFYNGAQEYVDAIVGLSPDQDRHETFIDIEPYTGLTMNGGKKIQINVDVKPYHDIRGLKNMRKMLFPLMYTNETAKIDQAGADQVNSQLEIPLKLMTAGQWILIGGGALTVVVAVALFFRGRSQVSGVV